METEEVPQTLDFWSDLTWLVTGQKFYRHTSIHKESKLCKYNNAEQLAQQKDFCVINFTLVLKFLTMSIYQQRSKVMNFHLYSTSKLHLFSNLPYLHIIH
jgi:hypothetical protein